MSQLAESAQQYARLKAVLADLSEIPVSERRQEAQRRLADDPELLGRVTGMLASLAGDEDFLEEDLPSLFGTVQLAGDDPGGADTMPEHRTGSTLGNYQILEQLGQGGMAVVYRARQTEPVEREVALKVISAHSTSNQQARFIHECNMLARLSHPNVATMYDAGISSSGEPWAAMELIEGAAITRFCTDQRLSLEQRVLLFIGACEGLAHAHRKGVLHRDIKPSNLLVKAVAGEPQAKVIDFGIAAALDQGGDGHTDLTGQHLIGTPAYMSPEAVYTVSRQSLDVRSDVYELGVVLCELLCGVRPYDEQALSLAGWLQKLSTQEAPGMTALFAQLPANRQAEVAALMGCSATTLKRRLGSDLGLVVQKALALEPDKRYASASAFADDLRSWLAGGAVRAHAPSTAYRARKFLRRHWIGAVTTSIVLMSLVGGFIARDMEARRTKQALAESDAVSGFLVDLLEHSSPLRVEGEDVLLQDIIDRGSAELNERFAGQPVVRARLLHTLGRVYGERGNYERGAELMQQSLALMDQEGVGSTIERLNLISDLGVALRRLGELDQAEALLERGLGVAVNIQHEHPLMVADLANSLGNVHVIRQNWRSAEENHRLALALREANLPAADLQITASRNNLATVLINSWEVEQALPIAQRVLEEWEVALPAGHPWIGIARNNLSVVYERLGRKQEALRMNMEALAEAERRLGPEHPDIADIWRNIGVLHSELGQRQEAEAAQKRHVEILAEALGPNATRTLNAELRFILASSGSRLEHEQALIALDQLRERMLLGEPDNGLRIRTEFARVHMLVQLGRANEAQAIVDELAGVIESTVVPGSLLDLTIERDKLRVRAALGHSGEAIEGLRALRLRAQEQLAPRAREYGLLVKTLTEVLLEAGRPEQAMVTGLEAIEFFESTYRDADVAIMAAMLGKACLDAGDLDCAATYLGQAESEMLKRYGAGSKRLMAVQEDLLLMNEARN